MPRHTSSDDSSSSGSNSAAEDEPRSPAASAAHQSSDESTSSDVVLVDLPGPPDQELSRDPDSGILVNIDGSTMQDPSRDDTFEDASDQLGSARSISLEESMAMIEFGETSSDQLARANARLTKTSAQCRKYKEEREVFGREVAGLRCQLRDMISHQSLLVAGSDGLLDHLRRLEQGEEDALSSPTPLHSMISECSKFIDHLKSILDDQLNSESMIRELHAILYSKDQELEDLNGKVSVSEVSHNVLVSYLGSLCEVWSESLTEKVNRFEEENRVMGEHVHLMGQKLEASNAEVSKTKAELDQSESRFAATREKLGIAVQKGKALVNTRDSLKQQLTERTNELENCTRELQQKSEVLEATQASVEQLKQSLAEKTSELEKCLMDSRKKSDDLESMEASAEELKRSLSEKNGEQEKCLLELQEKSDALEIANAIAEEMKQLMGDKTSELEKCLLELQWRSDESKATVDKLIETENMVHSLQDSLLHRDGVLRQIEEALSQNDSPIELLSLEIADRVRWFVNQKHIADGLLLENRRIRNALSSIDFPEVILSIDVDSQINWLGQSFTQAKDEIVKLQNEIASAQVGVASHESELSEALKEIDCLAASLLEEKQKKDTIQEVLEDLRGRYEHMAEQSSKDSLEKDGLLKVLAEISESSLDNDLPGNTDALVEKCIGKIRQRTESYLTERENFDRMQNLLYVKDQELTLFGAILEEVMSDRSEVMSLSTELGRTSEVMITLRNEKSSLQSELDRVEERSSQLRERLSMAVRKGKGLLQERDNLKQTLDGKDTEIKRLQDELQLRDSAIADYTEQIKSLSAYPEHIQRLESDIVILKNQRDEIERFLQESNNTLQKLLDAIEAVILPTDENFEGPEEKVNCIAEHIRKSEITRTHTMKELEEVKGEAELQARKIADASVIIKSLEDGLPEAEKKISVLAEEKRDMQLHMTSMEQELEKIKEETHMQASKLADAYTNIKSLDDALSEAKTRISQLTAEMNEAESKSKHEISTLNGKLAECMEQLAKTHGNLENQSGELVSYLGHLEKLMEDGNLLPLITEKLGEKIEVLKNMDLLIVDMHDQFTAKGLHVHSGAEHSPELGKLFSFPPFEDFIKGSMVHSMAVITDFDDVPSFAKVVEGLLAQAKLLKENFQQLSGYFDDHISCSMQALQAARDEFICILELYDSLKKNVDKLEAHNKGLESEMSFLQGETVKLFSACTKATQALQIEYVQSVLEKDEISFNLDSSSKEAVESGAEEGDAGESAKIAKSLIDASRRVRSQLQQLANDQKMRIATNNELKHKLEQAELIAATAIQDRQLSQEKVSKLEDDLEALETVCRELKVKIEDYQSKEDIHRDKEAELLSIQHTLTAKDKGNIPFSQDQMEALIDKANRVEVSSSESETQIQEGHFSSPVEKLFYILDKVTDLQHRLETLALEKEDMQLVLASHVHEVEHLKKAAEITDISYQDLDLKKTELTELTDGLERIIQRSGGNYSFEEQKPFTAKGLLQILDRMTIASNMESESLKSKIQDAGAKLQAKEKVVDDLSAKVKFLEDSIHAHLGQPDTVKERTVFESSTTPTGSEISEIEDVGSLGKNSISPAAAHVRTMRKGSTEHLVLNIDSESDRLIHSQETDDKDHFFKSLNASGLIPKQGKLMADRIDGIWVSGGRILMSRPGARLGLIAYWFFLHLWLLGTIL